MVITANHVILKINNNTIAHAFDPLICTTVILIKKENRKKHFSLSERGEGKAHEFVKAILVFFAITGSLFRVKFSREF